jgi:hypothetical protein
MLQPASQPYVGIDLHRRRSVIVLRSTEGETLSAIQVMNDDVVAFAKAVTDAGEHPEVAIEACYGWVRHEAPHDRVGGRAPPPACRSRPLKLEAA